jgi:hypothetical protein
MYLLMCVQVSNLIVLCKVQSSVSAMLTLLGQFLIMSFVANIRCQRWIAVIGDKISREENEDLERL